MNFDQNTITHTFNTLADVKTNTGLKVSYEKTRMYRVGSIANSDVKLYTPWKVKWSTDYINMLGIDISNSVNIRKAIFNETINKMRAVASMWYYKSMSLIGKVLIVNTMMASLYVYKMQVSTLIDDVYVGQIESIIEDFLWQGKKAKISLKILQGNHEDGGLGLVNIRTKHKALLFNWICDSISDNAISNLAIHFLGDKMCEGAVWRMNLSKRDSKDFCKGSSFWHQLVHAWHDYSYHEPQSGDSVREQLIWGNSMIRVGNKPVGVWKQPLLTVGDLWCRGIVMPRSH